MIDQNNVLSSENWFYWFIKTSRTYFICFWHSVWSIQQEIKNIPSGDEFQQALGMWQWVLIDGIKLPCIFRQQKRFVASRMVEMKILARFPPGLPQDNRCQLTSYKMLALEAWILNTVRCLSFVFSKYVWNILFYLFVTRYL